MASKVQDAQEIKQWIEQGKTYRWMVEQYKEKYDIDVVPSFFGNFRQRQGLKRRNVRDDALVPWAVKREHRYLYPALMLRVEARRRAGSKLTERDAESVTNWLARLEADGNVLHYDPDTDQGWWYIPRQPGDKDIIHEPGRVTKLRRSAS